MMQNIGNPIVSFPREISTSPPEKKTTFEGKRKDEMKPANGAIRRSSTASTTPILNSSSVSSTTNATPLNSAEKILIAKNMGAALKPLNLSGISNKQIGESPQLGRAQSMTHTKETISPKEMPLSTGAEQALKNGTDIVQRGAHSDSNITAKDYRDAAFALKSFQNEKPIITSLMLQLYELSAEKSSNVGMPALAKETRLEAALATNFSKNHPLNNMDKQIKVGTKRQALESIGDPHSELGSSKMPDGLTLRARTLVDDQGKNLGDFNCMNCRLSHNEAHKLKETIKGIKGENTTATLDLPGFGKMTIIDKPFVYLGKNDKGKFSEKAGSGADSMGYEISFTDQKGNTIGVAHTGSDLEYKLMYDAFHIRVPAGSKEGESLKEMQQMMTILGLGPGMGVKQDEDLERSKVFLMAQVFSPQAYDQVDFEHSTYQMSAPDLKKLICSKDPLMTSTFLRYENNLDLIGQIELVPGKKAFVLNDLSERLERLGGRGYVAGVGSYSSIAKIFQSGMLSTELRNECGIFGVGASPGDDAKSGGAINGFTRGLTEFNLGQQITPKTMKEKDGLMEVDDPYGTTLEDEAWLFHGAFQIGFKQSTVNGGALSFLEDKFAFCNTKCEAYKDYFKTTENPSGFYATRANLENFTHLLSTDLKDLNIDEYNLQKAKQDEYDEFMKQNPDSTKTRPIMTRTEKGYRIKTNDGVEEKVTTGIRNTKNEVCIPGGCIPPTQIDYINITPPFQTVGENMAYKTKIVDRLVKDGILKNIEYDENKNAITGTATYLGQEFSVRLLSDLKLEATSQ